MDLWDYVTSVALLFVVLSFFGGYYVYYMKCLKYEEMPNWYMRYATWWFDYFYVWWGIYYLDALIGDDNILKRDGTAFTPVYFWKDDLADVRNACVVAALVSLLFFIGAYIREFIMVYIWQKRLAAAKVKMILGFGNMRIWLWTTITGCFATSIVAMGVASGLFYWTEILLDWNSYYIVIVEYIIMSIGKDIFSMRLMHPIMHKSKRLHMWHHIHHSFKDDTTAWSTFTIHPFDITIENGSGPTLLLIFKFIIQSLYHGKPVLPSIHLAAYIFVSITDISIHSSNPFSVVYFNPLLDWMFLSNIAHALHHCPKQFRDIWGFQYYTQWPWHQIYPSKRKADIERYNEHFDTNFEFDIAPCLCAYKAKHRISSILMGEIEGIKQEIEVEELQAKESQEKYKNSVESVQEKLSEEPREV